MKILTALMLASVLLLSACSSTGSRASTETKTTNADLEQAVKNRLAADTRLASSRIDVSADVDRNQITLSGTLPDEQLRMEAVEIAKASRSGVVVVDKIEVKPAMASRSDYTEDMARTTREKAKELGDKVGTSLEDAWLYTKIMAKLVSDSNTPARRISVDVENSVVTLRGDVDSPKVRQEAERIARETDGVKRVINRLKVNAG